MEDDYQPIKTSQRKSRTGKTESVTKVDQAKQEKFKIFEDKKLSDYRRFQDKQIFELFNAQSKAIQKKTLKEFEQHLGKSLYLDIYLRDGLVNVLIADQLCDFIRGHKTVLISVIPSFAEFCSELAIAGEEVEAVTG